METPESRTLEDLDRRWGHLYDLALVQDRYVARRVDATGQPLTADTPEELDAAIRADQAER